MVEFTINIKKKHLAVFALAVVFFALGFAFAYGDFSTGQPAVLGHSSDEVNINIGGQTKTLQAAIDNADLGGGVWTAGGSGVISYMGGESWNRKNRSGRGF